MPSGISVELWTYGIFGREFCRCGILTEYEAQTRRISIVAASLWLRIDDGQSGSDILGGAQRLPR